jgi:hypothetical protein
MGAQDECRNKAIEEAIRGSVELRLDAEEDFCTKQYLYKNSQPFSKWSVTKLKNVSCSSTICRRKQKKW